MKPSFAGFSLSLLALLALPAFAVERVLTITAPAAASPGADVHVEIKASTSARDGEQIGFFQAEYSTDGSKTWVPVYAENVGTVSTRDVSFRAGPAGTPAVVRVRAAFRGGKAGDVDYMGKPIAWGETWGRWEVPPAKQVAIPVASR